MEITNRINIDFGRNEIPPHLSFMQGDSARQIEAKLYENNVPWDIPNGASVYIAFRRPDCENIKVVTLSDGSPIATYSGNVVTVSIPPEMTVATGNLQVVIVFIDGDGKQIATFPISVSVLSNPATDTEDAEPITRDLFDQLMGALAIERARITNLASLNEGSTTGDAELMDIRVGHDGNTYASAGDAVRGQFSQHEKDLAALGKTVIVGKNKYNPNDPDFMPGYRASGTTGAPSVNASTDLTGYIAVTPGETLVVSCANNENNRVWPGARFYAYDADKAFVSYQALDASQLYTVPTGAYFVRVAVQNKYNLYMIESGTEITKYEPYTGDTTIFNIPPEFLNLVVPTKTSQLENDSGFLTKSVKPLALPPTMYAFANQPVVTFLRNILPYDPGDVYVRMVTSNKGKLYGDRWEYTPAAAETVTVKYHVEDHNFNVLNDDTFSLVVKNTTEKESLKVLVIGDSTVNAGGETQKMLDLAAADGYDLTLLGTRGMAGSTNQHEGRGGWTAEMYVNQESAASGRVVNAFYNPASAGFDFSYYMTQQGYSGVDCVFIQLGINDLFSYKTDADLAAGIETYLSNMEAMVNSIHAYDANIKIVLNMIIPCAADQDSFTSTYGVVQTTWRCRKNTYDGNMALMEKFKNTSNVYISHFNSALDTVNNMDGGVHPVAAGYEQLGTQMYGFMRAIN